MDFHIGTVRRDTSVTVSFIGELDLASRGTVESMPDPVEPGVTELVIDLADLTFMDSSGVGVLIGLKSKASAAGASFRCIGARPQARRALEVLHLLDELGVSETL